MAADMVTIKWCLFKQRSCTMSTVLKSLMGATAVCAAMITAPGLAAASTPTTTAFTVPSETPAYWAGLEQGRREGRAMGANDARSANCNAGQHSHNHMNRRGTQADFDRGREAGQNAGYTIGWNLYCNNRHTGWEGQDNQSRQYEKNLNHPRN
jgi:hypothetical protein